MIFLDETREEVFFRFFTLLSRGIGMLATMAG
jgi:hypothetical protein